MRNNPYLVRPSNVGLGLPEHEEREHGHAVEYPDREAEEVYEALNVSAKDHHFGNKSLEKRWALKNILNSQPSRDLVTSSMLTTHVEEQCRCRSQVVLVYEGEGV